jgi:hypothetical protein
VVPEAERGHRRSRQRLQDFCGEMYFEKSLAGGAQTSTTILPPVWFDSITECPQSKTVALISLYSGQRPLFGNGLGQAFPA